ncbi:hypothetical protein FIBSPDRAFT_851607 [Athelia psychrophila]|uniref:Uncharacterized protein n=1 Tax=Athelia psychrophila TaxID=1759441 RepID=A0A166SB95_9AGAM|nr:hypothetical protein FIBSPDRAFT_851607 [Fibularhizoctonia sp. CBS 109695]
MPLVEPVPHVKAFPALTFPAGAAPGSKVTLTFNKATPPTLFTPRSTPARVQSKYAKIDPSDTLVTPRKTWRHRVRGNHYHYQWHDERGYQPCCRSGLFV